MNHQRVDVDHAILNQVQREHADLVVFPAVAGHLAATRKEHKIRGAVPLFDHVQAFVNFAAQLFRMQVLGFTPILAVAVMKICAPVCAVLR